MNLEKFITSNDKDFGLLEDVDVQKLSPEEVKNLGEDLTEKLVVLQEFIEKNFAGALSVLTGIVAAVITKITNDPSSALAVGAGVSVMMFVSAKVAKFLEGSPENI